MEQPGKGGPPGAAQLTAAIVGLGQVGSRFDEEPRPAVWSHAGAYLALPQTYTLLAGADPSEDQRARFSRRCPSARLFDDPVAMVAETRPDVVSVCTPPAGRAALVDRLLEAWRPRVLICEKPLELDQAARRALVARCARDNVGLLVNYVRRYQGTTRAAVRALRAGQVGRLVSVTVRAPNRLWSIGSHAVNLLVLLAGERPTSWSVQPVPALDEGGEPAANALFQFPSGASGALVTMGKKDVLVFEADVVGEAGRLLITENGDRVTVSQFAPSPAFVGYRLPEPPVLLAERAPAGSPFVELAREAAALAGRADRAADDGPDALQTESIVEEIIEICRKGRA